MVSIRTDPSTIIQYVNKKFSTTRLLAHSLAMHVSWCLGGQFGRSEMATKYIPRIASKFNFDVCLFFYSVKLKWQFCERDFWTGRRRSERERERENARSSDAIVI